MRREEFVRKSQQSFAFKKNVMKPFISATLVPRLDSRLAAYAAAGVAVAAATVATNAQATVVYSGPVSITVPNTINGVYLNVVTGATGAASAVPGYDINPYSSGGNLNFYSPASPGGVLDLGTTALRLNGGETIGSSGTFGSGVSSGTAFQTGGFGYVGFRFLNESTSTYDYGWALLSTTASTGFPATITSYAYQNDGGAILAGQIGGSSPAVPEPSTNAALAIGALALGAVGVRRWRQAKQTAA